MTEPEPFCGLWKYALFKLKAGSVVQDDPAFDRPESFFLLSAYNSTEKEFYIYENIESAAVFL